MIPRLAQQAHELCGLVPLHASHAINVNCDTCRAHQQPPGVRWLSGAADVPSGACSDGGGQAPAPAQNLSFVELFARLPGSCHRPERYQFAHACVILLLRRGASTGCLQRALLTLRAHHDCPTHRCGCRHRPDCVWRLPRAALVSPRRADSAVLSLPQHHAGAGGSRCVRVGVQGPNLLGHTSNLPWADRPNHASPAAKLTPRLPRVRAMQVPVYGHLVCGGCSIMLMYPQGAQSVKCSVCHYVSPVTASQAAPNAQPARP